MLQLLKWSDKQLAALLPKQTELGTDRYKTLSSYFSYFEEELRKHGCTLESLWKQYKATHDDGYQYTQFTRHFKDFKNTQRGSGKLNHLAGEKLYIDFAGKKMTFVEKQTGELIEVEVLICILPCSQYTFVTALKSQRIEAVVKGLVACLSFLGGVPKVIISDNLKSVVNKAHKYQPEINKTIRQLGLHYNCEVFATRPYKPRDKALVEGAVKLAYQRIYYPLSKHTFFSLEQINKAIKEKLEVYNQFCFTHRDTSRFKEYCKLEKPLLSALPSEPFRIKKYKRSKVQKMGFILLSEDRNYYSVPHRFIGKHVQIEYCSDYVEVFYNYERIALHKRSYRQGSYNAKEDHLSSHHKAYNHWSLAYFQKRARAIGPQCYFYLTKLIEAKTYPEAGYKQCQDILALQKSHGAQRLELACKRAADAPQKSYHTIARILERGLESESISSHSPSHIPEHKNLRGDQHYK